MGDQNGKISRVVFSDIDGTLMHDLEDANKDAELLITPPSLSGRVGVISAKSLEMVASLRSQNIKCVLISGARLSTLLMRMPYLPAADAFVCENGGRIFYPGGHLPAACPLTEDQEWRSRQGAAGPAEQQLVKPDSREGALWAWCRTLVQEGWTVDATGYTTSFRVHVKGGKTLEDLHRVVERAPPELVSTFNLGAADFYPATSGKIEAARFLLSRFQAAAEDSVLLCDDDNDMQLAAVVKKAFLPSISSDSVYTAIQANPEKFVRSDKHGTDATEQMLEAVASFYGVQL